MGRGLTNINLGPQVILGYSDGGCRAERYQFTFLVIASTLFVILSNNQKDSVFSGNKLNILTFKIHESTAEVTNVTPAFPNLSHTLRERRRNMSKTVEEAKK